METGDWVISGLIGFFGIVGALLLEQVGRALLSELGWVRHDLRQSMIVLERIEKGLIEISINTARISDHTDPYGLEIDDAHRSFRLSSQSWG